MDGVTVGHTRCNVSQCTNPLTSSRHRFCQFHTALDSQCAVDGCEREAVAPFCTCDLEDHRQRELRRKETGQSFSRLKARLARTVAERGQETRLPQQTPTPSPNSPTKRIRAALTR
jgi:CxC6 like cysteine cluster associated with KDZ transposases